MTVVHHLHALGDDRAFIQVVVDVVRGGTHQLHALVVGLVIGLGALEAGQQRVVDIDGLAVELAAQLGREHLHVAGKNHQLGTGLLDHLPDLTLLAWLVVRVQREMVVGNLVPVGQRLEVRVVGDHGGHVHGQLADALAVEQVVEAVIGLGDHDHHFRPVVRRGQFEQHAEGLTAQGEAGAEGQFVETVGLAKLHANEETPREAVIERVVLGDVAALLEQIAGHRIHRAEHAGAVGGQNPCIGGAAHCLTPVREGQPPSG